MGFDTYVKLRRTLKQVLTEKNYTLWKTYTFIQSHFTLIKSYNKNNYYTKI